MARKGKISVSASFTMLAEVSLLVTLGRFGRAGIWLEHDHTQIGRGSLSIGPEKPLIAQLEAWLVRTLSRTNLAMLVRYTFAGGLTTLVYFVVYNGALLFYSKGDPSSVTNGWVRFGFSSLAYGCALLLQYGAHGRFTFGHRQTRSGQLQRYLFTVAFGLFLAASVSAANYNLYVLPDAIVAIITSVLVAVSNFTLFNVWVYANDPHANLEQGGEERADGP